MATSPRWARHLRRPMRDLLLLVGMMGSGKTTVGLDLAERLGWEFVDTDEAVIRRTGSTPAEIFAARGEAGFRDEETAALIEILTAVGDIEPDGPHHGPVVVATGGGIVVTDVNRTLLADLAASHGAVVWLRGQPATLAARVGSAEDRPLLRGQPGEALAEIDARRRPWYSQVATAIVDVDGCSPPEVADRVLAAVGLPAGGA